MAYTCGGKSLMVAPARWSHTPAVGKSLGNTPIRWSHTPAVGKSLGDTPTRWLHTPAVSDALERRYRSAVPERIPFLAGTERNEFHFKIWGTEGNGNLDQIFVALRSKIVPPTVDKFWILPQLFSAITSIISSICLTFGRDFSHITTLLLIIHWQNKIFC